jgi:outer membrane biosynthesis protein TonB
VRRSLISSLVLHAAILGLALVTIQAQRETRAPEQEPIAVDLVPQGGLTKLGRGVRTAKAPETEAKPQPEADLAKLKAAKPSPPAAAPPPPPAEEAKPPTPEPSAQPSPSPQTPQPAEQRRKKKEEESKRQPEAKKWEFDASHIAALLNKTPDKGAPAQPADPSEQPLKTKGPQLGSPEGRDRQPSVSELAVLRQIIGTCVKSRWNVLAGARTLRAASSSCACASTPTARSLRLRKS